MASVLIGTHKCPFCGGRTHVKVKDEEGKKAYSHCLDEFDKGCSHTGHATTAAQDKLLRAAMKPIGGTATPTGPSPSPTGTEPAATEAAAPTPTPTPTGSEPTATATATDTPPKRRRLF